MKSIVKIAVEALVTISLIALLALMTALTYALLSLMTPDATASEPIVTTPTATVRTLAPAQELLSATPQAAPAIVTTAPDYTKMTVRELKPMARDRKIPNWTKLNKKELIAALSA